MAEEAEEEEDTRPAPSPEIDRRVVARFLDLIAAGFVALAVVKLFESAYGSASAAFVIGLCVFLCGIYWDQIRPRLGQTLATSMQRIASDARAWLLVLFVVFSYLAAPALVTIITRPAAPPAITSSNDDQHSLGPVWVTNMVSNLKGSIESLPGIPPWHVIITTPPENQRVGTNLQSLFTLSTKNVAIVQHPDYDKDIDAPKFPPTGLSGIILHGRNQLTEVLKRLWGDCFIVRQASDLPPAVTNYFGFSLTWIEIGSGSPWKSPQACND